MAAAAAAAAAEQRGDQREMAFLGTHSACGMDSMCVVFVPFLGERVGGA